MRRLVSTILVGLMAGGMVGIGPGGAAASPGPSAHATAQAPGERLCRIASSRLNELSGLVATDDGYIVVNDGTPSAAGRRIFYLGRDCGLTGRQVRYGGAGPRDPEDMVVSADGRTLWIADIGDNDRQRSTIGLWKMPVDGSSSPVLHRLRYPRGDGPHDAEALLLDGDGTPIIVTKGLQKSELYVPTSRLDPDDTDGVSMRRVGELTVPPSTTPGFVLGRGVISGGAVAPGGERVVLRTYTDALEWDVTDGDVLAALKAPPRVTPLPNERQGEAITYTPDGRSLLTVSDMQGAIGDDNPNYILRYTPATKVATSAASPGPTGGATGQPPAGTATGSWLDGLSLRDLTYLIGAVGGLGALLVALGVFGILRARRRAAQGSAPMTSATGTPSGPSGPRIGGREAETTQLPAVVDEPGPARPSGGARTSRPGEPGRPGGQSPPRTGAATSAAARLPVPPPLSPPPAVPARSASPRSAPHKGSGVYGGAAQATPPGGPAQGGVYGAPSAGRGPGSAPGRGSGPPPGR